MNGARSHFGSRSVVPRSRRARRSALVALAMRRKEIFSMSIECIARSLSDANQAQQDMTCLNALLSTYFRGRGLELTCQQGRAVDDELPVLKIIFSFPNALEVTSAKSICETISGVYTVASNFHVRIPAEIWWPSHDVLLRRYMSVVAQRPPAPCWSFSLSQSHEALIIAVAVARVFSMHNARIDKLLQLTWKFLGGIGHLLLAPEVGRVLEGFSAGERHGMLRDLRATEIRRVEEEMPVVVCYQIHVLGFGDAVTLTAYGQSRSVVERAMDDLIGVPTRRVALQTFEPEGDGELELAAGDIVTLIYDPDSDGQHNVDGWPGWVYGVNESTGIGGWFPLSWTHGIHPLSWTTMDPV